MIPASVSSGLLAFQSAASAAKPLAQAPALQVAALVAQGQALLDAIDGAIAAQAPILDAEEPTGFPMAMIGALNAIATAAEDQRTLSDMRGYLGRAVLNLGQGSI